MLRAENSQNEKMISALEGLGLDGGELAAAEKYLEGGSDEEALSGMKFRDMTEVPPEKTGPLDALFSSLFKKKRYEEAAKLFNLVYAVGGSTCYVCFRTVYDFNSVIQKDLMQVDRARALAAYMQSVADNHRQMSLYNFRAAMNTFVKSDPTMILRAYREYKGKYSNGKILLLTLYFYIRCGKNELAAVARKNGKTGKSVSSGQQSEGVLGGIRKLLSGKNPSGHGADQSRENPLPGLNLGEEILNDGDRELMREYEELVVGPLGMLFNPEASKDPVIVEIQRRIRQGGLSGGALTGNDASKTSPKVTLSQARSFQAMSSPELLRGLRGRAVNEIVFRLLGGCAYVNYMLSERLRSVVMVCAAASAEQMLREMGAMDLRQELEQIGGRLEELFGFSGRETVAWAAGQVQRGMSHQAAVNMDSLKGILRGQFLNNRDDFLEEYGKTGYQAAAVMAEIIRESDPELYRQEVLVKGRDVQRDKVKDMLVYNGRNVQLPRECGDYLEGKVDLDALYAVRNQLTVPIYGAYWECRKALEQYYDTYADEEFYSRCMALMALREVSYFFTTFRAKASEKEAFQRELEHIFQSFQRAGLKLTDQLKVVSRMLDGIYETNQKLAVKEGCVSIFQQYLAENTQETVEAFAGAGADGRCFALQVYDSEGHVQITEENRENCAAALAEFARGKDAWQAEILSYTQDSSKQVRQEMEKLLADRPGWREQVTALLSSKKAAERELGIRVLTQWNTSRDREALQALYEKEKNAKIRALLESALGCVSTGDETGKEGTNPVLTREDKVRELHKGGKKRSLAWAYETPFCPVHRKNGEQAPEEYLQALLLCYSSMTKPGISKDAALLAEDLNSQELAVYVGELFDKWMEAGAEAKKRWVLYAASIHGGSDIIKRLHHQIQEWPQNARGAIASDAVQALALNPQPQALLIVDGIARKFKFKQVRAAAGQALEFAAGQLGLTREELEDRIVPALGFDEHMERRFDYGSRSFTVTITPALEVEVFDEKGKKLKNMPAPGAKDDAEKAALAYGEFKEMKKQMKATVASQKQRLEMALSTERLWMASAWRELFVKNPIIHQFAIGLIWGVYEDHRLVQSFRYMEDGSFNTEDEEEYILPESGLESAAGITPGAQPESAAGTASGAQSESAAGTAPGAQPESGAEAAPGAQSESASGAVPRQVQIGLVHPLELSAESLETWKQQLQDYEITQPIEQLDRAVYHLTQEEREARSLERFGGMLINDLSLGGKLTALGWYRGSVQDAGGFYTYYREDASLGLGAELHFSGSFVGSGSMGGEEVTIYDVRFYKAGTIERGSYCYDEAEGEKQIFLKDIPPRYFSEIVWQLTKATASSQERDEKWKTEKGYA